jgi:hypothetical protein
MSHYSSEIYADVDAWVSEDELDLGWAEDLVEKLPLWYRR